MPCDLDAIRQRLEKATPGEWHYCTEQCPHEGGPECTPFGELQGSIHNSAGTLILESVWRNDSSSELDGSEADADLIAHAPTDLRSLCDELQAAREEGERLRAAMAQEPYIDFRGWRFYPPFICMGCGVPVGAKQWAFSRSCGPCDLGESKTRRLLYGQCFAGRREQLPTWSEEQRNIPEEHFIDPSERDNYPVISRPKAQPPLRPLKKFPPIPKNPRRIR